jgi:hypothetical protein
VKRRAKYEKGTIMIHENSEKDLNKELNLIVVRINALLTQYIEIHDVAFKFSLRKIIPLPFIFKAIDFDSLCYQPEKIKTELNTCNQQICYLIENGLNKNRFTYFLSEYCQALVVAVSLLRGILHQLYLKSQHSCEYTWGKYDEQIKLYDKAMNKYTTMGNDLNRLYAEFNR